MFLRILDRPGIHFYLFLLAQQVPGAYFFVLYLKMVILSKSCSRCGGSTILEGLTLHKSIRRATPNGTGKKKRQKSLPAPSPEAFFRLRARFLSILGSRPDPKNHKKAFPGKNFSSVSAPENDFLSFSSFRCVPDASRSDSEASGRSVGTDLAKVFRHFCCWVCRDL